MLAPMCEPDAVTGEDVRLVTVEDLEAILVKPEDWAAVQPTRTDLFRAAKGPPGLVQKVARALIAGRPDRAEALLAASVRQALAGD
jgi:hypothetical protein